MRADALLEGIEKRCKDAAGHEHGDDGKFVGTDGGGYKHGESTDFPYFRQTIAAPKTSGYGQDIEPHGRYMSERSQSEDEFDAWAKANESSRSKYEQGTVHFKNPIVMPFGGGYSDDTNWKRVLSNHYGGKTGKRLSQAIADDGFDGIITHDKYGTSETVDLGMFEPKQSAKKANTMKLEDVIGDRKTRRMLKVVDKNGVKHGPDGKFCEYSGVLHHGTEDKDFKLDDDKGDGFLGPGLYTTEYHSNAYGDHVHRYDVKGAKLLHFDGDREYEEAANKFYRDADGVRQNPQKKFRDVMSEKGYDGIRVDRGVPSAGIKSNIIVLWKPTKTTTELPETPEPWREDPYTKAGKVDELPIGWVEQFRGNQLRRNEDEMEEFTDKIRRNGITEPLIMQFGTGDHKLLLGEGNHRLEAARKAGLTHVPVRMLRQTTVDHPRARGISTHGDEMSRVVPGKYFKGDAAPHEVLDSFDLIGGKRVEP